MGASGDAGMEIRVTKLVDADHNWYISSMKEIEDEVDYVMTSIDNINTEYEATSTSTSDTEREEPTTTVCIDGEAGNGRQAAKTDTKVKLEPLLKDWEELDVPNDIEIDVDCAPTEIEHANTAVVSNKTPHTSETATGVQQPYKCAECDFETYRRRLLNSHLITHGSNVLLSCPHCEFTSIIMNELTDHLNKHIGEKPYRCSECEFEAAYASDLMKHIVKHDGAKRFSCTHCDYSSGFQSRLSKHVVKHTMKTLYSCIHCKYKCTRKSSLAYHMASHKSEKISYQCGKCGYRCTSRQLLSSHIKIHTDNKLKCCLLCDYKTEEESSLMDHVELHTDDNIVRREHFYKDPDPDDNSHGILGYKDEERDESDDNEMKSPDEDADKIGYTVTTSQQYLDVEIDCAPIEREVGSSRTSKTLPTRDGTEPKSFLMLHNKTDLFSCLCCEFTTASIHQLKSHMCGYASNRLHHCPQCNFQTTYEHDLINHMAEHTVTKRFKYKQREYSTSRSGPIRRTRKNTQPKKTLKKKVKVDRAPTGVEDVDTEAEAIRTSTTLTTAAEKLHKCTQCDFTCCESSSLSIHMTSHVQDKPHKCPQCEFRCSYIGDLSRHMRKHTSWKRRCVKGILDKI